MSSGSDAIPFGVVGLLVIVLAYFIPTAVAFGRGVPNKGSVLVVNLFFGWSVVGWVIALAMAARSR
ncbi:superinfection immunity protein [Streptomyces sp. NBC_01232]|uniref:superinfection immunity protein n=1 Tax=unclassified Streptomyces TaxID=2593676 RepID=UPI002E111BFD|nr:superinfection immunity protein [Streptomyces sp. NBC_01232]